MTHLAKNSDGHLVKNPAGHLATDCAGASEDCSFCADDCDDGASSVSITYSWNPVPTGSMTPVLNGTETVTRTSECWWGGSPSGGSSLKCIGGIWHMGATAIGGGYGGSPWHAALTCAGTHPTGSGQVTLTWGVGKTTVLSWTVG